MNAVFAICENATILKISQEILLSGLITLMLESYALDNGDVDSVFLFQLFGQLNRRFLPVRKINSNITSFCSKLLGDCCS